MEKKAVHLYKPEELEAIVGLTKEEKETTVSWSYDLPMATVWTSDNTTLTKMKKLMKEVPTLCLLKEVSWYKGNPVGYKFSVHKKFIRISKGRFKDGEESEEGEEADTEGAEG